jgi:hypothetical protein
MPSLSRMLHPPSVAASRKLLLRVMWHIEKKLVRRFGRRPSETEMRRAMELSLEHDWEGQIRRLKGGS